MCDVFVWCVSLLPVQRKIKLSFNLGTTKDGAGELIASAFRTNVVADFSGHMPKKRIRTQW